MIIFNIILSVGIIFALFLIYKRLDEQTVRSDRREVILDTSGVMDGRLLAIAKVGFSPGKLTVPNIVINELQSLADNGDDVKRQRARDGMNAIQELKSMNGLDVEVITLEGDDTPVDRQLVELAKKRKAKLYTVDYNLTQVARIEDVEVLNVNELSRAVRPLVLPGEHIDIKLVQKGKEPKQAVGYLENGTMVVVDRAHRLIGKEITVEATHFIQTESGKMLFAKKSSSSKLNRNNKSAKQSKAGAKQK